MITAHFETGTDRSTSISISLLTASDPFPCSLASLLPLGLMDDVKRKRYESDFSEGSKIAQKERKETEIN